MTHGLTVHCSNQLSYFPNIVVGSGGFEPTEAETADLQSAPFDHSGNYPVEKDRSRTYNLLIRSQALCR